MEIIEKTSVAIVGAGPTGVEMALALSRAGIPYLLFEGGQVANTIASWPRHTRFYSTPERIAIPGLPLTVFDQQHPTNDQYLAYLRAVMQQFNLRVHAYQPVKQINRLVDGSFELFTVKKGQELRYQADFIVLATGGLAESRKLGIPGEDLPHVKHYFKDPHAFFQQNLLVVGGRNSAVEYALRCWRAGARVTLNYRKSELPKASIKPHLLQDIETAIREDQIRFLGGMTPVEITRDSVIFAGCDPQGQPQQGQTTRLDFDFVLLCIGFQANMALFRQMGVELSGPEDAPFHNPGTMQTNIPGVFALGTAVGGTQVKFNHFIETSHEHVPKILAAIQQESARR